MNTPPTKHHHILGWRKDQRCGWPFIVNVGSRRRVVCGEIRPFTHSEPEHALSITFADMTHFLLPVLCIAEGGVGGGSGGDPNRLEKD